MIENNNYDMSTSPNIHTERSKIVEKLVLSFVFKSNAGYLRWSFPLVECRHMTQDKFVLPN